MDAPWDIENIISMPPEKIHTLVEEKYAVDAVDVDHTDGLSVEYEDWRFNLRMSNTEPVVRLNVESRGDQALMEEKTAELLGLLQNL